MFFVLFLIHSFEILLIIGWIRNITKKSVLYTSGVTLLFCSTLQFECWKLSKISFYSTSFHYKLNQLPLLPFSSRSLFILPILIHNSFSTVNHRTPKKWTHNCSQENRHSARMLIMQELKSPRWEERHRSEMTVVTIQEALALMITQLSLESHPITWLTTQVMKTYRAMEQNLQEKLPWEKKMAIWAPCTMESHASVIDADHCARWKQRDTEMTQTSELKAASRIVVLLTAASATDFTRQEALVGAAALQDAHAMPDNLVNYTWNVCLSFYCILLAMFLERTISWLNYFFVFTRCINRLIS